MQALLWSSSSRQIWKHGQKEKKNQPAELSLILTVNLSNNSKPKTYVSMGGSPSWLSSCVGLAPQQKQIPGWICEAISVAQSPGWIRQRASRAPACVSEFPDCGCNVARLWEPTARDTLSCTSSMFWQVSHSEPKGTLPSSVAFLRLFVTAARKLTQLQGSRITVSNSSQLDKWLLLPRPTGFHVFFTWCVSLCPKSIIHRGHFLNISCVGFSACCFICVAIDFLQKSCVTGSAMIFIS